MSPTTCEYVLRLSGLLRLQAFAYCCSTWRRPRGERLIDDDHVGALVGADQNVALIAARC